MSTSPAQPRPAPWPRLGVHKMADGTWMVPSESHPGLYHHVIYGRDGARGPLGPLGFKCSGCPRCKFLTHDGQVWMGTPDCPQTCSHVRKVADAEKADGLPKRPTPPPNIAGLVD